MKKIVSLLLTALLLGVLALPAFAEVEPLHYPPVSDQAKVLTESQETYLNLKVSGLREKYGVELFIVFADSYFGSHVEDGSVSTWNQYATASDGGIFYIAFDTSEWNIKGFGKMKDVYSEDVLDWMEEDCIPLLSDGNYAEAAGRFLEISETALTLAEAGEPYQAPFPWFTCLLIALALGFGIAGIVVLIFRGQLKSVAPKYTAGDYIKKGSLNVTVRRDLYLYHTTTRVAKPKNNSSGGRSGGGGGGSRSGRF